MADSTHILLLRDLAVVMIVAGLVTLLFHRLHQPVVLGYILAGLIIGPHTPPFPLIKDEGSIRTLADLGVIFLMFSLGLEFSLRTLKRVGTTAFMGAAIEILAMIWIGYEIGLLFGWSKIDSLFLGAILSISSTTIAVKVLTELRQTKAKFAELSFGILIVEDILAIALIALLSGIAATGSLELGRVLTTLGQIGVFLIVMLVVGLIFVPPLLRSVARYKSNEMLLVTVLGLCFGVSLVTVKLGYSVALGAFIIGTIVGEAREIGQIKHLTEPLRDMFSAVFFVTIGMLIDPGLIMKYALPVAVVTIAVVTGKVLTRTFGVFVAGNDTRTSLRVAMTLAQIGEFSFIIATLGQSLRPPTGEFLYPIAVSVSVITTLLTPLMIKKSDAIIERFDRAAPRWLVSYLEMYSEWLENLRLGRKHNQARSLVHKWAWQMAVNVALVTGVFMGAAFVAKPAERWWPDVPAGIGGAQGLVWLCAVVLALPGLIATIRKLQAFAMLLAELSITEGGSGLKALASRALLSRTITLAGLVGLCLWVLVISSAFLPPWPALTVLLLIVGLVTVLFWRFFIQIHSKAQVALRETLSQPPPAVGELEQPLPLILKEAQLGVVEISRSSVAAGKLIREVELRTRTGASAVGIERAGGSIINPGPDEELQPGDKVFLLGSRDQLDAARASLTKGETA